MSSRRATARLLTATPNTSTQTRSRVLVIQSRTCSCSYMTAAGNDTSSSSSTSSSTSSTASNEATAEAEDVRTTLLQAALPFIPEHGFTMRALQEASTTLSTNSSTTTSSSFPNTTSPIFLEQLFPSLPRRKHSFNPRKHILQRDVFKRAEKPYPLKEEVISEDMDEERVGPRKALFEAWAEAALKDLEAAEVNDAQNSAALRGGSPKKTVLELLHQRLEHNLPVLQHLPDALATLSKVDPSQPSLPTFRPYLSHVGNIAKHIKLVSQSNISTPRLATVYSLSELYQLSRTRPDIEAVLDYADDLMKRTEKYDGLIKDSFGFAGYAIKSWRNIINARGL